MTMIAQRRIVRIAIALAGMLTAVVLALSLAPLGAARADTAPTPRLGLDFGMPVEAPRPASSPPAAATDAPAEVAAPAPIPAAAEGPTLKRMLVIDGPFRHGDYVWDDAGVPAGEVIVTVDIKAQTIAVFRAGYQIGAAVILYGADDKPTPLGSFKVTQKKVHHVSNLYNAPMPYMLRLTDDGIAIHASDVSWGNATHGCIGVPLAFAKLLYKQAALGTRVVITEGKMMAVPAGTQTAQAGLAH